MSVLQTIFLFFGMALLTQLALFRLINPKREFKFLIFIFIVWFLLAEALVFRDWSIRKSVHFGLFYFSLLGTYMMTYLNTKEPGPTFFMLQYLETHRRTDKNSFLALFAQQDIIGHRIGEMVKGGVVVVDGDRYTITPYGRRYLWFFTFYRKFLKVKIRGG